MGGSRFRLPPQSALRESSKGQLKVKSRGQLNEARVAAEYVRRHVEVRLAHTVDLVHTCGGDWVHTVDRTGNVLRVIEDIKQIRSQLELLAAFTHGGVLADCEIHILNGRRTNS